MTAEDVPLRVKTPAGGHALPDAEYNRRWFARVLARTVFGENGCWIWQGFCTHKGYGSTAYRGANVAIHRKVYELTHGVELPTEVFACHKCDTRACWNPAHLFEGDAATNNRDCGNKGRHHNSVKTHCKRGHEFTPENTYLKITPTTVMRACKACQRENQLRRYQANREEHNTRNRVYRQRRKEREAAQNS
jgi:hypothetical protein